MAQLIWWYVVQAQLSQEVKRADMLSAELNRHQDGASFKGSKQRATADALGTSRSPAGVNMILARQTTCDVGRLTVQHHAIVIRMLGIVVHDMSDRYSNTMIQESILADERRLCIRAVFVCGNCYVSKTLALASAGFCELLAVTVMSQTLSVRQVVTNCKPFLLEQLAITAIDQNTALQ